MIAEKLIKEIEDENKNPAYLEKNDLFLIYSGFHYQKYRVIKKLHNGVWAHWLKAMKSDAQYFTYNELIESSSYQYFGKISKLRAFFLL